MIRSAVISECGRYRYRLDRDWSKPRCGRIDRGLCVFVMLNPSTADGETDDPTIRRCVGFAQREGFGRLAVVNLFAYRATDPIELVSGRNFGPREGPVGPDNEQYLGAARRGADILIVAWGSHAGRLGSLVEREAHAWHPDGLFGARFGAAVM